MLDFFSKCPYCGQPLELWDYGKTKAWRCRKHDLVRSKTAKKIYSLEDRAKQDEQIKISDDYRARFGWHSGPLNEETIQAMVRSMQTGIDEFAEAKRKYLEHVEECERERERKYQELLAKPFTAKTERDYTRKIKRGKLREGDCELAWPMYFKYREEHPNAVEPLTEDDLEYIGQWTSCGT